MPQAPNTHYSELHLQDLAEAQKIIQEGLDAQGNVLATRQAVLRLLGHLQVTPKLQQQIQELADIKTGANLMTPERETYTDILKEAQKIVEAERNSLQGVLNGTQPDTQISNASSANQNPWEALGVDIRADTPHPKKAGFREQLQKWLSGESDVYTPKPEASGIDSVPSAETTPLALATPTSPAKSDLLSKAPASAPIPSTIRPAAPTLIQKIENSRLEQARKREAIAKLARRLLEPDDLYQPKTDAASRALEKLLLSAPPSKFATLENFLKKPSRRVVAGLEEFNGKPIGELEAEIESMDEEIKLTDADIKAREDVIKGVKAKTVDMEEIKEIANARREFTQAKLKKEQRKRLIRAAIEQNKKEGLQSYDSVEHLLQMAYVHLTENGNSPSPATVQKKVQNLIEAQEPKLRKVSKGWGLLQPTLEGTLELIGQKDPVLRGIDAKQMKELGKGHENVTEVREWLKKISGNAADEILPRVIAYMSLCVREGKAMNVPFISRGKAKKLLENLEAVRHEEAMKWTKKQMEKAEGTPEELQAQKMEVYFRRLNEMTTKEGEINQNFAKHLGKKRAGKAVGKAASFMAALTGKALWKSKGHMSEMAANTGLYWLKTLALPLALVSAEYRKSLLTFRHAKWANWSLTGKKPEETPKAEAAKETVKKTSPDSPNPKKDDLKAA